MEGKLCEPRTDLSWNGLALWPSSKFRTNKDYFLFISCGIESVYLFVLGHFDWTVKPVNQFSRQVNCQRPDQICRCSYCNWSNVKKTYSKNWKKIWTSKRNAVIWTIWFFIIEKWDQIHVANSTNPDQTVPAGVLYPTKFPTKHEMRLKSICVCGETGWRVGQISTNLLGHWFMFSGYGPRSFVLFVKQLLCDSCTLGEFWKVNLSFYYTCTLIHSDKLNLLKNESFSFLDFKMKDGVLFSKKVHAMQCKINNAVFLKKIKNFIHVSLKRVLRNFPTLCILWSGVIEQRFGVEY